MTFTPITRTLAALAASAALGAAALPAFAADPALGEGGVKLSTTLTGAAEVPGPGDSDGTGTFSARVNPGKGEVCYTLTVAGIDAATGAHIHTGKAGVAGPVAVALEAPADGSSDACATITRDLAMALIKTPGDYYVNVHNAAFPAGAVRGQLVK
ncbi:CHRD domain-containing protein [Novosphingobium sp.]|uniref:CHRD domain-containing protein n=1 Tax=Novosphingobium sp. TaxID=1874826 RepID=UPI00286DD59A|nr:CHRD domain-containing protein [Novosphingobium sp.]